MAHKKAAGSTRLGRDSQSKRLGIKIYGDQPAKAGEVIVRQRGLPYHPGLNVKRAGDDTLYALADGLVHYRSRKVHEFTGQLVNRRYVDVTPARHPAVPLRSLVRRVEHSSNRQQTIEEVEGSRSAPVILTSPVILSKAKDLDSSVAPQNDKPKKAKK